MEQLLNTWLPPAVIITVVIYTNRLLANGINKRIDDLGTGLNRRIDDLRSQMSREHDTLAKKVDETNSRLSETNSRLGRIEQNHLDHITQLHTSPKQSNS